jgi:uncharacterized protein (DUF433 family)
MLGSAVIEAPRRPWGETSWIDAVPPGDPLFAESDRLGYGGPSNYRAMVRLREWTEDLGEIRRRAPGCVPLAAAGTPLLGLTAGRILTELTPGVLRAPQAAPEDEVLSRITVDPAVLHGKPTVRGLRIAVEHVLGWLAAGATVEEVVESYPELEAEDVRACLRYAQRRLANERIEPSVA